MEERQAPHDDVVGVISWMTEAERVALRWMLRWVSSAPLGRPVVPEV